MQRRAFLNKLISSAASCYCAYAYADPGERKALREELVLDQSGPLSESDFLEKTRLAFESGFRKIVISRNITISASLIVPSGVELTFLGKILNRSPAAALLMRNINSSTVNFKAIIGDGASEKQAGIVIENSSDCVVDGVVIKGNLNKGVDVRSTSSGISERNSITVREISGSTGDDGAGISIFGRGSQRNRISRGIFRGNRIGITVNGGCYNEISNASCNDNSQAGIMLDGVVSKSGDGASFNILRSITCNENGMKNGRYGGLYLGNGASFNRIKSLSASGNGGAGCRMSGGSGFELKGNAFDEIELIDNKNGGVMSSHGVNTSISRINAIRNRNNGIHLFASDHTSISGMSSNNTGDGLLVQSNNVRVTRFSATQNEGFGIRVAYGGGAKPLVVIRSVSVQGNTRGDYLDPGGCIKQLDE
jgi:hypothetical protein